MEVGVSIFITLFAIERNPSECWDDENGELATFVYIFFM